MIKFTKERISGAVAEPGDEKSDTRKSPGTTKRRGTSASKGGSTRGRSRGKGRGKREMDDKEENEESKKIQL